MKKIFIGIYYFLTTIGFILFLFVFSLILTSFAYFNNDINTINKTIEISPYLQEEVKSFICYGEKEIVIEVEFLNYKNEEFLLDNTCLCGVFTRLLSEGEPLPDARRGTQYRRFGYGGLG